MMNRGRRPSALIIWALILGGCDKGGDPRWAPNLLSKPPPLLLLHDWFGRSPIATPSFIREHREFLDSQPFDGLAVYLRKPDLTLNVSATTLSGKPVSYEEAVEVLAPLKGIAFRNLTENFAAVVGGRPPDFMEDWAIPIANFAHLARASRAAGLKGIYIDNESYQTPWSDYPRGVLQPTRSLQEYQDQARLRGRQVMEAMVSEFPDIIVLLLHGPYVSEPEAPSPLFPRWQSRNELLGPFFVGFVEGAGSRATIVDGGELYGLRTEEHFRQSREWRKTGLPSAEVDCAFLPSPLRAQWKDRVSVGFGIIDQPFNGHRMNPEILSTTLMHALRQTDRYVWLYIEGPTFLSPPGEGGAPSEWVEAVRRVRGRKSTGIRKNPQAYLDPILILPMNRVRGHS